MHNFRLALQDLDLVWVASWTKKSFVPEDFEGHKSLKNYEK